MVKLELKNNTVTRVMIAEKGKNLCEFAKEISISQAYLTQILKGDRKPSPTVAHKIAKGLSCEIKDLFFINTDNKRYNIVAEDIYLKCNKGWENAKH